MAVPQESTERPRLRTTSEARRVAWLKHGFGRRLARSWWKFLLLLLAVVLLALLVGFLFESLVPGS